MTFFDLADTIITLRRLFREAWTRYRLDTPHGPSGGSLVASRRYGHLPGTTAPVLLAALPAREAQEHPGPGLFASL